MSGLVSNNLDKNVLRLTLNDPASGNLLSDAMLSAILTALDEGKKASVVVLSSLATDFSIGRPKPPKTSGLAPDNAAKVRGALDMVHAVNMRLRDWPGVTVGVLRGQANGAAAGFMINCDVVIAEPDAKLGFAEMTYDLPPGLVASYLPNRIAARIAQYMLLTGEAVDMQRALAWGLVHEVHPAAELGQRADALVKFMASRAPGALNHCKRSLHAFAGEKHAVAGPKGVDHVLEWLSRPSPTAQA